GLPCWLMLRVGETFLSRWLILRVGETLLSRWQRDSLPYLARSRATGPFTALPHLRHRRAWQAPAILSPPSTLGNGPSRRRTENFHPRDAGSKNEKHRTDC